MKIPYSYTLRNLWARKLTTLLTAGGMALVVFVFSTVLMLEEGLRKTLVDTGSCDNVVVIRRSSQDRGAERRRSHAGRADRKPAGGRARRRRRAAGLEGNRGAGQSQQARFSGKPTNVLVRGVGAGGLGIAAAGENRRRARMFRPGSSEIIAGRSAAERFKGAGIGETLWFGLREWRVVGTFDAGKSGFDSEIWGDADQLMQAFRRPVYSAVVFKLSRFRRASTTFKARLSKAIRASRRSQTRNPVSMPTSPQVLANFIKYLGLTLSLIFSIGAVIGAMITMYASVASRTAEIGTLRALGFRNAACSAAFLLEAVLLGMAGGCVGLFLASFMQLFTISTMNWQSFSELAFSFTLTPAIAVEDAGVCAGDGRDRRIPAGGARRAPEYRRCAARGLNCRMSRQGDSV